MRKQRPTKTRSVKGRKKGYKLRGLTPAEARRRTEKGWITKRQRYQYGRKPHPVAWDPVEPPRKGDTYDKWKQRYDAAIEARAGEGGERLIPVPQPDDAFFTNKANLMDWGRDAAAVHAGEDADVMRWYASKSEKEKREARDFLTTDASHDPKKVQKLLGEIKDEGFRRKARQVIFAAPGARKGIMTGMSPQARAQLLEMARRFDEMKRDEHAVVPVELAQKKERALMMAQRKGIRETLGKIAKTRRNSEERKLLLDKLSEAEKDKILGVRDPKTNIREGGLLTRIDQIQGEIIAANKGRLPSDSEYDMIRERGGEVQRSIAIRTLVGSRINQYNEDTGELDRVATTYTKEKTPWGPIKGKTFDTPEVVKEKKQNIYLDLVSSPVIQQSLAEAPTTKKGIAGEALTPREIRATLKLIAHHATLSHTAEGNQTLPGGITTIASRDFHRQRALALGQDLGVKLERNQERLRETRELKELHNRVIGKIDRGPSIPDISNVTDRGPIRDRRLERLTVDEAYRFSGHEDLKDFKNQKLGVKGTVGFKDKNLVNLLLRKHDDDPRSKFRRFVSPDNLTGQVGFIAKAQQKRIRAAREGTIQMGWDAQGKRTSPPKATFGIGPNKVWEYKLNVRDPKDPNRLLDIQKIQHVDLDDPKEYHHKGKRHADTGKLKEGEWDEIADIDLVTKFHGVTGAKLTNQRLSNKLIKEADKDLLDPAIVVEREFIPVPGLTRIVTKNVNSEKATVAKVKDVRRVPANAPDLLAPRLNVSVRDNAAVLGKKRIYYVPPHLLSSEGKSEVAVVVPGIKRARIGSRLLYARVNENTTTELKIPGLGGVGPDIPTGRLLTARGRDQQVRERERLSQANAWSQKQRIGPHWREVTALEAMRKSDRGIDEPYTEARDQHLKLIASASAGAMYYTGRRKFRRGIAPTYLNKIVNKATSKSERLTGLRTKYRVPQQIVNVKEQVRPARLVVAETAANWKTNLAHPTGTGVQWVTPLYRDKYISEEKFLARQSKLKRLELTRVGNTKHYVEQNIYGGGRVGKRLAKHRNYIAQHPDYKDFLDNLTKAEEHAGSILDNPAAGVKAHTEARKLKDAIIAQRKLHTPQVQAVLEHTTGPVSKGLELVVPTAKQGFVARNQKTLLVSGAVVGSAMGAHYLYHKYRESKKPAEDRVSYYNKVLPKSFSTPALPAVKVKFWHTPDHPVARELLLANKPIFPTSVNVAMKKRRVTLRPAERDPEAYKKNLPVFGNLKLRGAKGSKGGSLKKSVVYELDRPRKRYFQPSHSNVYIGGKKTPITVSRGDWESPKLTGTNKQRLSTEDREKLAYMFGAKPNMSMDDKILAEQATRDFRRLMGDDEKLMDLVGDPDKLKDLRKKHATGMQKRFGDALDAARAERLRNVEVKAKDKAAYTKWRLEHAGTISWIGFLPTRQGSPTRPQSGSAKGAGTLLDQDQGRQRKSQKAGTRGQVASSFIQGENLSTKGTKQFEQADIRSRPTRTVVETTISQAGYKAKGRVTKRAPQPPVQDVYGYDVKVGTRKTGGMVYPEKGDPFPERVIDKSATRITRQPKSTEDAFKDTINFYRGPRKARIRKKK